MKIAILGCGPAGLFAAHAAVGQGHDVTILSKPRKSFMRGAQYLHRPIPGLSGEPFEIDYRLEGPVDGYRAKVYGDFSDVQVSPETLVGIAQAWDIREAYDNAWVEYAPLIRQFEIGHVNQLANLIRQYDMIISTVPRRLLCADPQNHHFESQAIWSTDYVKRLGVFEEKDGAPIPDNIVVCSGFEDDWWYRQSRIHGWENTEFGYDHKPAGKAWLVEKPLSHNCDCQPDIVTTGRYGSWKKGVLSDASFYDIEDMLKNEYKLFDAVEAHALRSQE